VGDTKAAEGPGVGARLSAEESEMNRGLAGAAALLAISGAISIGCSSDDDSGTAATGGAGASGVAGKGGTTSTGGSTGSAGTTAGGKGGTSAGGSGGNAQNSGGAAGAVEEGGATNGGAAEGGAAGETSSYTAEMVTRGAEIVRGIALCGGCHTATGGAELGGNAQFKNGALPAPNLTSDATGLGDWSDEQIINAFRNGIDDEGRHLDPAMPYWLFHNMSDADAMSVVAFLRSLPKSVGDIGANNPEATAVTPLAASAFPDSSLLASDSNYAAAQAGKYLVSGIAQCVRCHSASTAGLPSGSFFSGAPPANNTTIFGSNLTPDATGISGWTADDVATALKVGKNKDGVTLCGSMPSGTKGYANMSDADAHAIGVYLTTIPAVSKPTAEPSLEPACP